MQKLPLKWCFFRLGLIDDRKKRKRAKPHSIVLNRLSYNQALASPMPYFTRKRIKRVQTGFQNDYLLCVDLNDDEFWERYSLFFEPEISYLFRVNGKVCFISDKDDKVVCDARKNYDFSIRCNREYEPQTRKYFYKNYTLYLPESLTNGFGLRDGMGIEITLNEFIKVNVDNEPQLLVDLSKIEKKIVANAEYNGIKDFELKGINGELLNSSEVLVSTKFTNEFYISLITEINTAYKINLWTSTKILLRKLFENLLIELLRERYRNDSTKTSFYYSKGQYQSFQNLKEAFKDANVLNDIGQFDQTIVKDKSFIPFLEKIRLHGDKNAHTMEIIHDSEEIKELKDDINNYSALLVRLINKISGRTDVC